MDYQECFYVVSLFGKRDLREKYAKNLQKRHVFWHGDSASQLAMESNPSFDDILESDAVVFINPNAKISFSLCDSLWFAVANNKSVFFTDGLYFAISPEESDWEMYNTGSTTEALRDTLMMLSDCGYKMITYGHGGDCVGFIPNDVSEADFRKFANVLDNITCQL